jgi:8-oxo-dGTP pyrophosphatase MutT (NUDIX family)
VPHIHAQIDFVNAAFIVHPDEPKVLLIYHKKLDGWYAPGGHIELHETPDEALVREVYEETGLTIGKDVVLKQPDHTKFFGIIWNALNPDTNHEAKQQLLPWAVEVHNFPPVAGHRHVALVYLGRSKIDDVWLSAAEHVNIAWFDKAMLNNPEQRMIGTIRAYGVTAIEEYYK